MPSSEFTGKRLFLLRHATALAQTSSGDAERLLAPSGVEDAQALGELMSAEGCVPDAILCSTAMRTRQTLVGVLPEFDQGNVQFLDILYDGSVGDYLYEIQKVSDAYQNILLVAHNPCIYELVILLAAQGHDAVMQRLSEGYRPASFSVIHCACDKWSEIQPAVNELATLVDPMDYNVPARPTRWM
ncbi:MAG: hypothetical protein COA45_08235 [Zetaproteobacteria bacterium]|nr:MAG: hypothetical protein COA45_08235 [Zetaproteobacteria bacterium]